MKREDLKAMNLTDEEKTGETQSCWHLKDKRIVEILLCL